MGKHQLSQVHLKLPKRTRQLPSRKHKALRNLIACDMIHTRLILLHNWLHKHLLLLLFKSNKTKSCKLFFFCSITRTPFGSSENKTRETHQKQKKIKVNKTPKTKGGGANWATAHWIWLSFSHYKIFPPPNEKQIKPTIHFFSFLSFSQQPNSV